MDLLVAEQVTKTYANHKALDEVSINVPEGSIFGLLGPNGAGKTTLIRIINQITAPDSGKVFLRGEALQPKHTALIGYLPEERGLYKKMTVGDQAIYLSRLKGLSKSDSIKRLKYWFEKFEIDSWWNRKVEELSKGMQQKVQFITTVVHQPKLLIFDEPFSGFDPINANLIKKEILQLRDNGATVIFSTHNMGSVEELCDNIALINKSVKIEDGTTDEIRDKYKSNIFEIKYRGGFDEITRAIGEQYKIIDHSETTRENHLKVQFLNGNSNNELLKSLMPVAEIIAFEEVIPGMNEVFIKAVEKANK